MIRQASEATSCGRITRTIYYGRSQHHCRLSSPFMVRRLSSLVAREESNRRWHLLWAEAGADILFVQRSTADTIKGVAVNTVAPGYIATEMNKGLMEDKEHVPSILGSISAGRWWKTRRFPKVRSFFLPVGRVLCFTARGGHWWGLDWWMNKRKRSPEKKVTGHQPRELRYNRLYESAFRW